MIYLLIYSLLLIIAVWVGLIMCTHPGYVLISLNHLSIETTFWVAMIALIILFLVVHTILTFTTQISFTVKRFKQWFSLRKMRKTVQGLLELMEGDWKAAEKHLARSINFQTVTINYLAAAIAAQKQHQFSRRDFYLNAAENKTTKIAKKNIAAGIIRAKLQIESNQLEEALATLRRLVQMQPRNVLVLKYLYQVLLVLRDYQSLVKMLPNLRKRKVLTDTQCDQLEITIYSELMQKFIKTDSSSCDVTSFWKQLPKRLKIKPQVLLVYLEYLLTEKKHSQLIESLIKDALKKTWDAKLVEKFGQLVSEHPLKQLRTAEHWLKQHPRSIELHLCLGRICRAQQLWGPAKYYFDKSLKIAPNRAAYYELASLAEIQGQTIEAMELYKKAAALISDTDN